MPPPLLVRLRLVGRGIGQLAGEPGNTFFRDPVFELQGGLDRIDIAVGNAKRRGVDLGLEFPADADGNPLVIGIRRVARQILAILYTRKELRQHGSRHGIVLDRLILGREFLRPDSDRELLQCRDCAATQSVEVSALPIVRIPARHARLPGLPAIDLGLILLFSLDDGLLGDIVGPCILLPAGQVEIAATQQLGRTVHGLAQVHQPPAAEFVGILGGTRHGRPDIAIQRIVIVNAAA